MKMKHCLIAFAVLFWASAVGAQNKKGGKKTPIVEAKVPVIEDGDVTIAKGHLSNGKAFYAAGKYEKALVEFEDAYRAKALPDFEYNIAQCLEKLNRFEDAVQRYVAYRKKIVHPDEIAAVDGILKRLEGKIADRDRAKVLPVIPPIPVVEPINPPPKPVPIVLPVQVRVVPPAQLPVVLPTQPTRGELTKQWFTRYRIPVTVLAGAFVFSGTGAGLMGSSDSDYNRFLTSCSPRCNQSEVDGAITRGNVGTGFLIAGGVLLAVDVVLWLYTGLRHPR